ncbi:hypothetical protein ACVIYL_004580 [Bradyrhizobium sp. USDA 3315]
MSLALRKLKCLTHIGIGLTSKVPLDAIFENSDASRMRYPGGMGRIYQRLISMMPPHRVYIETRLGGGAIRRAKQPAQRSIGVEIDPSVVAERRIDFDIRAEIVHGDALEFLKTYDVVGGEGVGCDPPYLPNTRRRAKAYRFDYREHDHVELSPSFRPLLCAVMLSGYPSQLYDAALPGWRGVEIAATTYVGAATEIVWMNYGRPPVLHDHSHVGRGFGEREAIKRRRIRLVSRIRRIPPGSAARCMPSSRRAEPELFQAGLSAGSGFGEEDAGDSRYPRRLRTNLPEGITVRPSGDQRRS